MKVKFFSSSNYSELEQSINTFLKNKDDDNIIAIEYKLQSPYKTVMIVYKEDYEDFSEDYRTYENNLYS